MSAVRKYREDYNVDGNAARKLHVIPDYDRRREEQQLEYERRRRQANRNARRQLERSKSFDLKSLMILTAALVATIYMAIGYLQAQALYRSNEKELVAVQKEILSIRDENNAIKDMAPTLDLTEVYRIATEELGMVHATNNQKIQYESAKPDYVKQYGEVPEGESSILDNILD